MKTIVNYPTNALLWHFYNNCGLNDKAVWAIIDVINKVNSGELSLLSTISSDSDCTVEEMLIDLHIDYDTADCASFNLN